MDKNIILKEVEGLFTQFYNQELDQSTLNFKLKDLKVNEYFSREELYLISQEICKKVRLK